MNDNQNPMDHLNNLNDTPNATGAYTKQDIEGNKGMAVLSYFSILVLIPVFAAKNSPFARFHANQGMILFVIEAILWVVSMVLGWIPVIGWLLSIVIWVLELGLLALSVLGIINAVQGQAKELPVLGGIRILK